MQTLEVKNLVKTFTISEAQRKALELDERKKTAVAGISFTAHSGEIFGLLGPNGAGKTTTMRMLATLIKPDSGDALYNNISAVSSPEKVRASLAFLTAELKLDIKSTASDMYDFFALLGILQASDVSNYFMAQNMYNFQPNSALVYSKQDEIPDISSEAKQKIYKSGGENHG